MGSEMIHKDPLGSAKRTRSSAFPLAETNPSNLFYGFAEPISEPISGTLLLTRPAWWEGGGEGTGFVQLQVREAFATCGHLWSLVITFGRGSWWEGGGWNRLCEPLSFCLGVMLCVSPDGSGSARTSSLTSLVRTHIESVRAAKANEQKRKRAELIRSAGFSQVQ
eukprot:3470531-Pyramimonas_sp.AAC.1